MRLSSPPRRAASGDHPRPAAPRIAFVSLGCPKALVDSEQIISRLRAEGYELTKSYDGAAAVIVNTCGFLDSAKAESLAAIGAAAAENGKIIVTGCMGAEPAAIEADFPNLFASPVRRLSNRSCGRSMRPSPRRTIRSSIFCRRKA